MKKKILTLAALATFALSGIGCTTTKNYVALEPNFSTEMEERKYNYDLLMSTYNVYSDTSPSFDNLDYAVEETLRFMGDISVYDMSGLIGAINTYSSSNESPKSLMESVRRTVECLDGRDLSVAAELMNCINLYSDDLSAETLVDRFCEKVDKLYD